MSKLLFFIRYLKYFFVSKTKHGVHSPFVYDLVTNVINDKSYKKNHSKIRLLNCFTNNSKQLELIDRIINHYKLENILEIGSCKHLNRILLSNIQSKANLFFYNLKTFEISEFKTRNNIQSKSFDFAFYNLRSNEYLTLTEFMNHLKFFHNNSIVAINNIHHSIKMEKVWSKIIAQKQVTISIDLFYIGFVFFRKEQVKENFIIRF